MPDQRITYYEIYGKKFKTQALADEAKIEMAKAGTLKHPTAEPVEFNIVIYDNVDDAIPELADAKAGVGKMTGDERQAVEDLGKWIK